MRPRWRGRHGGNTLGAAVGGPRGTAGMKAHRVLGGTLLERPGGSRLQREGGRLSAAEEEEEEG